MTLSEQPRRHFADLDGLRGVLAVAVMLYHFGLNTLLNAVVPVGPVLWDLCVDFFFALSGFVLCRSVLQTGVGPALFAWRRVGRLLPMHLAIIALFGSYIGWFAIGPRLLVLEVTALGPLLGSMMENFPAWSMSFELYLPIVAVAGLAWVGRPSPALSGAVGAIMVLLIAWLTWLMFSGAVYPMAPWIQWARAAAGLALGFACWLWLAPRDWLTQENLPPWLFPLCALLFCLTILFGTRLPLLAVVLPVLIVATLCVGTRSRSLLSTWPFAWLGRLSFGIYMVHIPVLGAFRLYSDGTSIDGNVPLKLAMIATTLGLALALHLLVEMPVMRWFRHWPGRRAVAAQP